MSFMNIVHLDCLLSFIVDLLNLVLFQLFTSEIWMVQGLFGWNSGFGIFVQHWLEQVPSFFTKKFEVIAFVINFTLTVFLYDFLDLFSFENWLLEESKIKNELQYMEDNSQRENVALRVVSFDFIGWFNLQNFRRNVSRSSTSDIQVLFLVPIFSQSQINNHWQYLIGVFRILLDHNVLKFKIPVHDPLLMKIVNSFQQSLHNSFDFDFTWETILL